MECDFEYNELTKQLLQEGYTTANYPDYVQIGSGQFTGDDPLRNSSHGFEYKRVYSDNFVYYTGCGKCVLGKNVIDSMGYMGIEWCHENDNPVILCPYHKSECSNNAPELCGTNGGVRMLCWCVCHRQNKPYDYDNSIEKVNEERHDEMERKYQEYSELHGGKVCRNHMFYDEHTGTWEQQYKPSRCAKMCISQNGYCPILGKQLSKKRGNVYYDLKKTGIIQQKEAQQSLFDNKQWTSITKGIRFFDKPCSMDICEAFVKIQKDEIKRHYDINHSFEKMADKTIDWEILNIRVENKPSRDLMQDLEDIKNGISISFDNDIKKHEKEYKQEKKRQAQINSIKKLEKKLITIGYYNLAAHSLDRVHADKWLSKDRINELEKIRQQKLDEEYSKPVQLSLFD